MLWILHLSLVPRIAPSQKSWEGTKALDRLPVNTHSALPSPVAEAGSAPSASLGAAPPLLQEGWRTPVTEPGGG